jgi:hypothetical protein
LAPLEVGKGIGRSNEDVVGTSEVPSDRSSKLHLPGVDGGGEQCEAQRGDQDPGAKGQRAWPTTPQLGEYEPPQESVLVRPANIYMVTIYLWQRNWSRDPGGTCQRRDISGRASQVTDLV